MPKPWEPKEPINLKMYTLLMCIRQAIIMVLGGIEDFLEMERSIVPKRKRN